MFVKNGQKSFLVEEDIYKINIWYGYDYDLEIG